MPHRALFAVFAAVICLAPPAGAASYGRQGGSYEEGFFVFLDAAFATPTDLDQVVGYNVAANSDPQVSSVLAPEWGGTAVGRLGAGWRFASGATLSASYWRFDDDERLAADGPADGYMNFAIGPAVYYEGVPSLNFGIPGSAEFEVSTRAQLVDLDFAQEADVNEHLAMEWKVGLRYATFEEDYDGTYDLCARAGCTAGYDYFPGEVAYDVAKRNESSMFGAHGAVRARFALSRTVRLAGGAGLSLLTGTIEGRSGLTPVGSFNVIDPPTSQTAKEDRSGMIADLDVGLEWEIVPDLLRLSGGWQVSRWDGVPYDVVRNTPGILTANRDREVVSFSGPYLGLWVRF